MTLDPLLSASAIIILHATSATLALLLGPFALYGRKANRHRWTGYVWVLAMALTALSSFGITSFGVVGPFSPIHLLSVLTLWSLWRSITAIRRGAVALHQKIMRGLYWYGLLIAGLFNFLPDRTTNRIFFDGNDHLGWLVIAAGASVYLIAALRRRFQARRPGGNLEVLT